SSLEPEHLWLCINGKVCQTVYAGLMATMNVSLPDGLKEFVETQVGERGYGTSSEFVRDLIRREQARTQLRALLVEGMGSGPGSEMDEAYFQRMRERIQLSGPA
ncbi:type II toxin-antitoxin system ParD family antitoxin, partial [Citricoccus sp.]